MFKKLKQTLVESFVGAIALGWLLAQGVLHFTYVFSAPVAGWIARREYSGLMGRAPSSFSFQDALPKLVRSFALLLLCYLLLRWLYFSPIKNDATGPAINSE